MSEKINLDDFKTKQYTHENRTKFMTKYYNESIKIK